MDRKGDRIKRNVWSRYLYLALRQPSLAKDLARVLSDLWWGALDLGFGLAEVGGDTEVTTACGPRSNRRCELCTKKNGVQTPAALAASWLRRQASTTLVRTEGLLDEAVSPELLDDPRVVLLVQQILVAVVESTRTIVLS